MAKYSKEKADKAAKKKDLKEEMNPLDRAISDFTTVAKAYVEKTNMSILGVCSAMDFVSFNLRAGVRDATQQQMMAGLGKALTEKEIAKGKPN